MLAVLLPWGGWKVSGKVYMSNRSGSTKLPTNHVTLAILLHFRVSVSMTGSTILSIVYGICT
jgi:hypothetical protein